jgi:hypothetical protein
MAGEAAYENLRAWLEREILATSQEDGLFQEESAVQEDMSMQLQLAQESYLLDVTWHIALK